jgi:N-acylneuraminate cytidylyltransferase/CMP-N,N'-diacetyllegionaminic acid synthase
MNIVAIIPARGSSKRIPYKNIKKLAGKPLIAYTIREALRSKTLDRIIVSTENDKIAKISKKYGAEVPFKRPAYLARDTTHSPPIIKHAIEYLEKKEKYNVDIVVILQPTSPFRKAEHIDLAVKKMIETNADSVASICEASYPPYWMKKLKKDKISPFVKSKIDYHLLEGQQLPKVYQLNGAIYVVKRDFLMKKNKIIDGDARAIIMDSIHSLDVDTLLDFLLAEVVIKNGLFK